MRRRSFTELARALATAPRPLFLGDGCGALLSAFLLGVVVVRFERFFGIPTGVLHFLSVLPLGVALYDWGVYYLRPRSWGPWLRGNALINAAYCFLSLGLAFTHRAQLTPWGWGYLLGEVLLVLTLALLEWRVAELLKSGNAPRN